MRIRRKNDKPTVAQLYARVSTEEQAEKGLSLPAQIEELRRYCRERGIAIFREYIEPGVSGTDDNRREFRRMIKDALEPSSKVDAILVLTTSRFMRNVDMADSARRNCGARASASSRSSRRPLSMPRGIFAEGMFELFDQDCDGVQVARNRSQTKSLRFEGNGSATCKRIFVLRRTSPSRQRRKSR